MAHEIPLEIKRHLRRGGDRKDDDGNRVRSGAILFPLAKVECGGIVSCMVCFEGIKIRLSTEIGFIEMELCQMDCWNIIISVC